MSGRNNQLTILSITFSIILTSMFCRDVSNFFHFKFIHPFFHLSLYIVLIFKKYVSGHEVSVSAKQLIINDAYYVERRENI